jgi:hypothetical protein
MLILFIRGEFGNVKQLPCFTLHRDIGLCATCSCSCDSTWEGLLESYRFVSLLWLLSGQPHGHTSKPLIWWILWHGWRNRRQGSRELWGLARWCNKRFPPLRDNTGKHSPASDDVATERCRCYESTLHTLLRGDVAAHPTSDTNVTCLATEDAVRIVNWFI